MYFPAYVTWIVSLGTLNVVNSPPAPLAASDEDLLINWRNWRKTNLVVTNVDLYSGIP